MAFSSPPSRSIRLQLIVHELRSLHRDKHAIPRARALFQEASKIMKITTVEERSTLKPIWRSLKGIFDDLVDSVIGVAEDALDTFLGGEEEYEER